MSRSIGSPVPYRSQMCLWDSHSLRKAQMMLGCIYITLKVQTDTEGPDHAVPYMSVQRLKNWCDVFISQDSMSGS